MCSACLHNQLISYWSLSNTWHKQAKKLGLLRYF
ncbi:hypothetical protein T09_10282 [Trichinella sp. T9]|nr:hypothetical protein T09_10282 [Trichinella sp. T9]